MESSPGPHFPHSHPVGQFKWPDCRGAYIVCTYVVGTIGWSSGYAVLGFDWKPTNLHLGREIPIDSYTQYTMDMAIGQTDRGERWREMLYLKVLTEVLIVYVWYTWRRPHTKNNLTHLQHPNIIQHILSHTHQIITQITEYSYSWMLAYIPGYHGDPMYPGLSADLSPIHIT